MRLLLAIIFALISLRASCQKCVLDSTIYTADTIIVNETSINGEEWIRFKITSKNMITFELDGDCGSSPTYTLLRQNKNGTWEQVFSNEGGTKMTCGLPSCEGTSASGTIYPKGMKCKKGIYKITVNTGGKTFQSSTFRI